MSERATADIVIDLLERAADIPLAREAADRLATLDCRLAGYETECAMWAAQARSGR